MTLSCAEHQWKDIERLIKQRMQMAGTDPNFFDQNPTKWINDYSIVVQEYFSEMGFILVEDNWNKKFSH